MRTLNIKNRLASAGLFHAPAIRNAGCAAALIFIACSFYGCQNNLQPNKARRFAKESAVYYQQALSEYQSAIARSAQPSRLYFELGQLYYNHGDFEKAIDAFQKSEEGPAHKLSAISFYRRGNFTDALSLFNRQESADDESLYYHGLTCERLNLFDQAVSVYQKIKSREFARMALARVEAIEKRTSLQQSAHIRDISPEIYEILNRAPSQEKYPQAGALILHCDEKIEVAKEKTMVSTLHYVVKILNERGKQNFAESSIEYDSTYEKVELEYARTIRPDGQVAEVGSRHIRDVSQYLNFPLYSNARVFIISFPEITEGSSIEYKVKIYRSRLVNDRDFVLRYPLQTAEPVIFARFTVSTPSDAAVHLKIINDGYNDFGANLQPRKKQHNGFAYYSWEFKDIPQIIPENMMPPGSEINPTILLSTFSRWQEVYEWWWKLAKDKIKADNDIKKQVKILIPGRTSEEEKARALYNFCAQKIRYVAVEYGQAGHEPHRAEDIFRNKYGDCKDQAILLVTMLREAGIPAYPVLISTKDSYDLIDDFPSIAFNHCIAAVWLKDKIIFLDPTAETCSFGDLPSGDQQRRVLIFKDDGYLIQQTPLFEASHNLIKQRIAIKVRPDETIAAEKTIQTFGIYDQSQRYWFLYTPPQLVEENIKEHIQSVSIGAQLLNYNIKNIERLDAPLVLDYNFSGPEYFVLAGSLRIMPQLSGLPTAFVAKDQRRYPLDFEILNSKETLFEIEIPRNFVIKYIPESFGHENPWIKFSIAYSRNNKGLMMKELIEYKRTTVLQEEYQDFKRSCEELAKRLKQRVILEGR